MRRKKNRNYFGINANFPCRPLWARLLRDGHDRGLNIGDFLYKICKAYYRSIDATKTLTVPTVAPKKSIWKRMFG